MEVGESKYKVRTTNSTWTFRLRISFHNRTVAMSEDNKGTKLSATYTSPTDSKTFTTPLSNATDAPRSTSDKTAYLSDLRGKVTQLQADVNAFLTARMQREQVGGNDADAEAREEDMYGEEDPENEG